MAAVTAFPHFDFAFLKYLRRFYVAEQCAVTFFVVLFNCGNQTEFPDSILDGVRTMTANIVLELGYAEGLHRGALIATAAVLFVFILIITLLVSLIRKKAK